MVYLLVAMALGMVDDPTIVTYTLESSGIAISNTTTSHRVVGTAVYSGTTSPAFWRIGNALSSGHAKILTQAASVRLATTSGAATCVDASNRVYGYDNEFISPFTYLVNHRWSVSNTNVVTVSQTWTPAAESPGKRTGIINGCSDGLLAVGGSEVYNPTQVFNYYITTTYTSSGGIVKQPNVDPFAESPGSTGGEKADWAMDINNGGGVVGNTGGVTPDPMPAWYTTSSGGTMATPTGITSGMTPADTANAINDDNYVTGTIGGAAYIAHPTSITSTAVPTNGSAVEGFGINASKTIVGGYQYSYTDPVTHHVTIYPYGFAWTPGSISIYHPGFVWDLPAGQTAVGSSVIKISGIADDGHVCGDATVSIDTNSDGIADTTFNGAFIGKL